MCTGDHAQSGEAVGRAAIGTAARGALVLTPVRNLEIETEGDLAAELRAWLGVGLGLGAGFGFGLGLGLGAGSGEG